MSLKYVVLGLLTQRARYGYELKRDAEQLLGSGADLNPGQLYPLLRKLADHRLIVGERIEQEDRPDKRVFTLTEAGASDLETWLDEPVPPQVGRSPLFLHFVVLAYVRPGACAEFLRQQRHRLLGSIGQLVADRAKHQNSDDLATLALREATILHLEADLKWIEWLESLNLEAHLIASSNAIPAQGASHVHPRASSASGGEDRDARTGTDSTARTDEDVSARR